MTRSGLLATARGVLCAVSLAAAAACADTSTPVEPATPPPILVDRGRMAPDTGMIATPAGWRYRRCVHEVPNNARVDAHGRVTRHDGTTFQLPLCAGGAPPADPLPPTVSGWVEWGDWAPGGNFSRLSANWTVPANPTGSYSAGQVYYAFPGLQSSSYIIQPVLQYGNNNSFGGSYWVGSSWQCDSGPDCTHGSVISMAAGDAVYGNVTANNCANGQCSWTISTQNGRTGQTSIWTKTNTQSFYDAVGGAVEVYGLTTCSQFPSTGIFFNGIAVYNSAGVQVTPSWTNIVTSGLTPSCGYSATSSALAVSLYHNPPPPSPPTITSATTNPSPARQYLSFTLTINGSNFDPANVEVTLVNGTGSSCPAPGGCNVTLSSKTSTQLVGSVALSLTGTYTVRARNGTSAWASAPTTITVAPF
jgi:hypothetical protein